MVVTNELTERECIDICLSRQLDKRSFFQDTRSDEPQGHGYPCSER